MMRATDAPAAMKPISTENLSRLLLNLKRFSYSNFFKKKKTSNAFRNYLAIAFKKFKLFRNILFHIFFFFVFVSSHPPFRTHRENIEPRRGHFA